MAALYTYPEHEGRDRFSPAKWTGRHGERAVDLAWTRANEAATNEDGYDATWWGEHEAEFPEEMRGELYGLYAEALARVRSYLEGSK